MRAKEPGTRICSFLLFDFLASGRSVIPSFRAVPQTALRSAAAVALRTPSQRTTSLHRHQWNELNSTLAQCRSALLGVENTPYSRTVSGDQTMHKIIYF